jgi:folate-binding protein YgfZ
MKNGAFFHLSETRSILAVAGEDRQAFLQGLISNDMRRVTADQAIYAAFLTPQGKYLHDLFLAEVDGHYAVDCEAPRRADLVKRLTMFRLRSKVTVTDAGADWVAAVLYGDTALARLGLESHPGRAKALDRGVAFVDPRLAALGARAILPRDSAAAILTAAGFEQGSAEAYDRVRIELGVADGSRDLVVEKAILLENGFDELNGVDWQKGCYMGQELTARTKYRGLVRKRLLPVTIEGAAPAFGTPLMLGEQEAGEMRSTAADGGQGLAMIRIEHLARAQAEGLKAGEARLKPIVPDWVKLPEQVG